MKKLIYIALLLPMVLLSSCLKDDEDVFGKTASVRTQEAANSLNEILRSAPNGWVMDYYPEEEQSFGGYQLLLKFAGNDSTIMASEDVPTPNASLYRVKAEQGVMLTFDTYNLALHLFSDPSDEYGGSRGDGYLGDYEFFLDNATSGRIDLVGKKTNNKIVLRPLAATTKWSEYIDSVDVVNDAMTAVSTTFALAVGDAQPVKAGTIDTKRQMLLLDTVSTAVVVTSQGFRLYHNVELGGHKVSEFKYNFDSENPVFTAVETDKVRLMPIPLPINETFCQMLSSWDIHTDAADCSSSFYSNVVAVALNNSDGYGETLDAFQLSNVFINSAQSSVLQTAVRIYSGGYNAFYSFAVNAVNNTENQIQFTAGVAGLNAAYYPVKLTATYLQAMSPWTIEADDEKKPTLIKLTSAADSNVWFTITNE